MIVSFTIGFYFIEDSKDNKFSDKWMVFFTIMAIGNFHDYEGHVV